MRLLAAVALVVVAVVLRKPLGRVAHPAHRDVGRRPLVVSVAPRSSPRVALAPEQLDWVEAASGKVDEDRLRELAVARRHRSRARRAARRRWLGSSPTRVRRRGARREVQQLDGEQANALARVRGTGGGVDAAAVRADRHVDRRVIRREDVPWIGPELRADMPRRAVRRRAVRQRSRSIEPEGPRGVRRRGARGDRRGRCARSAATCWAASGPAACPRTPDGDRPHVGHGVGCAFMLEHGTAADSAVIAKPGWTVSWEEVGLIWVDVEIHGTHTYVGSRHRLPYRNADRDAATVVEEPRGLVPRVRRAGTPTAPSRPRASSPRPEAAGGDLAAVTPATCRLLVDLRVSPRTSPPDALVELAPRSRRRRAARPVDRPRAGPRDPRHGHARDEPGRRGRGRGDGRRSRVATHVVIRDELRRDRREHPPRPRCPDGPRRHAEGERTPRRPRLDFQRGMNTVDVREMERLTPPADPRRDQPVQP